jgi:hypothetical protein
MLIGVRLGGYTDFWIAGVRLGDIYKFHTMGRLAPYYLFPYTWFYYQI